MNLPGVLGRSRTLTLISCHSPQRVWSKSKEVESFEIRSGEFWNKRWRVLKYLSMSKEVNPDPVPPPNEWKRRNPWICFRQLRLNRSTERWSRWQKILNLKAWACIRQFSYPVKNKVHHFLQAVDKEIWQIVDETRPPHNVTALWWFYHVTTYQ